MRRVYRVLAVLIILGALITGALIFMVRYVPDTEIVRSGVQEKLRALTGHDVTIGTLRVSTAFPRLVHLRLEGISITSPQGKALVSADSLVLSPSLVSLFSGEVNVESATITGLRGTLESPEAKQPSAGGAESVPLKQPLRQPVGGKETEQPPSVQVPKKKDETTDAKPKQGFRWSLNSVRLVDARLDWIDKQSVPGREVLVSLNGVDGTLSGTPDHAFRVQFSGLLGIDKASAGPVKMSGTIKMTEEFSGLDAADLEVTAASLSLKPFHMLLPAVASPAREFSTASMTCRLIRDGSGPPKITCRADLKTGEHRPSQVTLQGDLLVTPDFSRIQEANGTVETPGLPLHILQTVLPESWPVDPKAGVATASLQGAWSGGDNWQLSGTAGVESAVLKGAFKGIAEPVRAWAQFKLNSERLLVDSLDIFGSTKLASVTGKVTKPFSTAYGLDLRGDIAFEPRWLKSFGMRLPASVEIQGSVPVRGVMRQHGGEFWVDATGDLSGQEIHWTPYVRKAPGNKGNLSFKGKIVPAHGQKEKHQRVESLIRLSLAGTSIRLSSSAPWITGSSVQLDSRVLANGGRWDLKDANLAIRRGAAAGDLLTARANVSGLESSAPKIDAAATVNLDKGLLSLAGIDLPPGSTIGGNAPVKLLFGGTTNNLDWSAEFPLTHLDINIKQAFRKPGGINGSLSASGKFTGSGLTLGNGRLSLPGVVVHGQGTLADDKGNFGSLTCTIRKSDLKDVTKLIPSTAGMGLSGPAEASIVLKPVHDTVTPGGTIRLLSVDYRPEKAGWGLEKVKGTLALEGTSMAIPEVTGNIVGSLEGPFKVKGTLTNIGALDALNGGLSVEVGQGRIKADKLRGLLSQAQLLIGTLLNPQSPDRRKDPLEIQSVSGDFQINSGTVRTDNLSIKGPDVNSGAIGSLRLASNELDILVGVQTVTAVGEAIGKIPAVRQFIKKHEGILSATGLDKELKRFGLDTKDSNEQKTDTPSAVKTPVTVLFRLHGAAGSPQATPVFEQSVNKATLARLKSLMN